MSLGRRLLAAGEDRPDALAAAFEDEEISFGELARRARSLADEIAARRRARNAGPLDIGLYLRNGVDLVVAFVGVCLTDSRLVVLDPAWPAAQLERVLASGSGASIDLSLVLTSTAEQDRFAGYGVEPLIVSEVADHAAGAEDTAPAASGDPRAIDPSPSAEFLVMFTSGTTNVPKGITRNQQSWSLSLGLSAEIFGSGRADRTLAPGPLSHGLTLYALAESLYGGGTFLGAHRFDAGEVHALGRRFEPTRLVGVPTAIEQLVQHDPRPGVESDWFPALHTLVTSGEKMSRSAQRLFFERASAATHFEYYGASELSFVSYRATVAPGAPVASGGSGAGSAPDGAAVDNAAVVDPENFDLGVPFPSVEIEVRDDEGRALEAPGLGTIWVRSPLISSGYLRASDRGFLTDGLWASVGDQGFFRSGRLHLIGRGGEMINRHGNNIHPSEIEHALIEHPGIGEAYVFADEHSLELVAVVSPASSAPPLSAPSLRAFLLERLAKYKVPTQYWVLAELPRTSSGKIMRNTVRRLLLEESAELRKVDGAP